MRSRFETFHPAVLFLYFTVILVTAAFSSHPLLQGFSLVGGLLYCGLTQTGKEFGRMLGFYLIPALLIALSNPFFSREGDTPLFFVNGLPVTKEALLYGVYMGIMMISVLCWFRVLSSVMTGDRMLYLFGGALPKLSLLLTVTVRTVPLLRRRIVQTREAQQALGLYSAEAGYVHRLRCEMRVFRTVLAAAAEDAIESGDSMRARGYGLPGRTSFRVKRFTVGDGIGILMLMALTVTVYAGILSGALQMTFYPGIAYELWDWKTLACAGCFGILCLYPATSICWERGRWNCLVSRI